MSIGGGVATTDLPAKSLPISIIRDWSDPFWRLNHLYQVIDEEGKQVPFKLRPMQEEFLRAMWYMDVILKARQHGFTTAIMYYFLDQVVFNSNIRAGIIAHTLGDVEILFRDKVKFAYDSLPAEVRETRKLLKDTGHEILLSNNSSVRVGMSMRSGTLQYLLITEHGTICAKYPEKAKEIKTGSLNTVHAGQILIIESTAKGRSGDFYDIATRAQNHQQAGKPLSAMDFKFFFYPWWRKPEYRLDPAHVPIPDKMQAYFNKLLAEHDVRLSREQKAWYTKKWELQGSDLKQEHPSTPEEAFEAAIQGAYYAHELQWLRENGRITKVPHDPTKMVDTWWDIGLDDQTSIWFTQNHGMTIRVFKYYENANYALKHYTEFLRSLPYQYGRHVLPHDGGKREYTNAGPGNVAMTIDATARQLGLRGVEVNPRGEIEMGIRAVRNLLPSMWFDEENCATGLKCLEEYRKEWNPAQSCYMEKPLHNWASNGADAARTLATSHRFTSSVIARQEQPVSPGGWT